MKIVATVSDGNLALHLGLSVEHESAIIEIPDDKIPAIVKRYFNNIQWAKEQQEKGNKSASCCETLSFSLLSE